MKAFDPNYKLLDEMYQDDYYCLLYTSCERDTYENLVGTEHLDGRKAAVWIFPPRSSITPIMASR